MSFSYFIETTFTNGLDTAKLYKDIRGGIMKPTTAGISGDYYVIEFPTGLSSPQSDTLNTIITTHTGTPESEGVNFFIIPLSDEQFNNTSYTSCGAFEYPGRNIDSLTNIRYTGSVSTGNYSIRIYDVTNSQILAEGTFSNVSKAINDLGTLTNIPYNNVLIDVQIKTSSSGAYATPFSLSFHYNN